MLSSSAGAATAESKEEVRQERLENLSAVLGKAHAVHVTCNGLTDQYWRDSMTRLLDLEASDNDKLENKLIAKFNNGYSEQDAKLDACDQNARTAFEKLSTEGKRISEMLNADISAGQQ